MTELSLSGGHASKAELTGILYSIDPAGLRGVVLRGRPGPVRDGWLSGVRKLMPGESVWTKLPVGVCKDRLLGGLDFAATLDAGKSVIAEGILSRADGGTLLLAMAERLESSTAAIINAALDSRGVKVERSGYADRRKSCFGVIALDEGIDDDECVDSSLADRLAFHVQLEQTGIDDVSFGGWSREAIAISRRRLAAVTMPDSVLRAIGATAFALGIDSARAGLIALRAARAIAALEDHPEVTQEDASLAAQLVLAHRAQCLPTEEPPTEEQSAEDDSPNPDESERQDPSSTELQDVVLEATRAAIPDGLLAAAADLHRSRRKTGGRGRNGVKRASQKRGRPVGMVPADRVKDGRINLLATLKAALPWQTIRRQQAKVDRPLHLRKADLQVTRFKDCNESTTVFVVDASGSQAAQRLGEVKGAIELLLAECYVRRDQVALIVFRGNKAEVVLAPTRALARAKKTLAAIPAGGGTPLSAGIDLARELVESVRRQGRTPKVVFLTDGRANIARDGSKNREFASSEALQTARLFGGMGIKPIVVDSSRRPRVSAEELADAMRALYLPMPYADAAAINAAVAHHGKI